MLCVDIEDLNNTINNNKHNTYFFQSDHGECINKDHMLSHETNYRKT